MDIYSYFQPANGTIDQLLSATVKQVLSSVTARCAAISKDPPVSQDFARSVTGGIGANAVKSCVPS